MGSPRWQKIQELFAAALECPEEQRADFLDERCGGARELRQEVEALLRAESGADTFLGSRIGRGVELLDEALGHATGSPAKLGRPLAKAGKYEILREIGQGGFGTVFEGRDPDLRRRVAIKACTSRDPDQRERFFREGRIAAALRHPNITQVYDVGIEGDVPYLVQEYLSGRDLSELIAEDTLETSAKLDLLVQIASGLAFAHGKGVLHRDVKPSNVRVVDAGRPGRAAPGRAAPGRAKILDFGIARLLHGAETRLTRTGAMIGTLGYLAPEQLEGKNVDQRADVFSFGVLAYELLSGVPPFAGETLAIVSYRLLYSDPRPLHVAWPSCPDRRLSRIVGRCLEKPVDRRWTSLDEVASVLREVRASLADGRAARPASAAALRRAGISLGVLVTVAVAVWLGVRSPDELEGPPGAEAPSTTVEAPVTVASGEEGPPREDAGGGETPRNGSADTSESRSEDEPSAADGKDSAAADPTALEAVSAASEAEDAALESAPHPPPATGSEEPPPQDIAAAAQEAPAPATKEEPEEARHEASGAEGAESSESAMHFGDPIPKPGPGVVLPTVVELVKPVYPKRARRRRQAARVIVAVYVDETGTVIDTFLKQKDDSGLGFNEAALAAARRTRFAPATRDGVAGRMWTEIPYDFRVRR